MAEQDKHNLADVSKHTPGKADARRWMGSESDPRWTIMLGGAVRFITAGDNDENNAIEAKRRWNSHDALLKACKDLLEFIEPQLKREGGIVGCRENHLCIACKAKEIVAKAEKGA